MRVKSLFAIAFAFSLLCPTNVSAQARNPFQPPAPGSGLSKEEVQRIVAEEASKKNGAVPDGLPVSGVPVGPGMIPPQLGIPSISSAPVEAEVSRVDKFFEEGGIFVGCVGSKPMFSTKTGKRVYFSTRDIRKSNEARHFVNC